MKIERVDTPRCQLGEGAVWDFESRALYFLDIFGCKIIRHDPATGETRSWQAPQNVGAMAIRQRGDGAILAMRDAIYAFDFASGGATKLAGPAFDGSHITVNDGATDRRGRFVFGGCSLGLEDPQPVGGLYSIDASHRITQLDDGVHQSNGHCFSPDGCTLYCADSYLSTMYAYDYDIDTGRVSNKRIFAETSALGGVPDGSVVDADGIVWMSIFNGGKVAAYRPDGRLDRVIDMPVKLIASLAWGGDHLDRLFVATIDPTVFGWPAEEGSGHLYVVDGLGARGVPETRCAL